MLIRLFLLLLIMMPLYGCVDAAVSGAQAIYNRHSIQKNLCDQYITLQVTRAINDTRLFQDCSISVSSFNRVVLLTGQVLHPWQRAELDKIVRKIPDIKKIYNLTIISTPSSNLTQVSDAWITAKIKSKLIAANEVDPSQIKVVTENGTVYLMGIIPPSQAKAAIYLARTTEGVQNVVKIFSYLKICKEM